MNQSQRVAWSATRSVLEIFRRLGAPFTCGGGTALRVCLYVCLWDATRALSVWWQPSNIAHTHARILRRCFHCTLCCCMLGVGVMCACAVVWRTSGRHPPHISYLSDHKHIHAPCTFVCAVRMQTSRAASPCPSTQPTNRLKPRPPSQPPPPPWVHLFSGWVLHSRLHIAHTHYATLAACH